MIRIKEEKLEEILDALEREAQSDGLNIDTYEEKIHRPFKDYIFLDQKKEKLDEDEYEEYAGEFKNSDSVVESGGIKISSNDLGQVLYTITNLKHEELENEDISVTAEQIDGAIKMIEEKTGIRR